MNMVDWEPRRRRSYDPFSDQYLRDYFSAPAIKRQLLIVGLMTKDGQIIPDSEFKRQEVKIRQRVAARQQIAHRMALDAREAHLARQLELQKQLEAVSKIELYRKLRGDSGQRNLMSMAPLELEQSLSRSQSAPSYKIRSRSSANTSIPPLTSPENQFQSSGYHSDDDRPKSDAIGADENLRRRRALRRRYLSELSRYRYLHRLDNESLQRYDDYLRLQLSRLERAVRLPFTAGYVDVDDLTSIQPTAGLPEIPERAIDGYTNITSGRGRSQTRWRHLNFLQNGTADASRSDSLGRFNSQNAANSSQPNPRLFVTSAAVRRRRQPQVSCECFIQYLGPLAPSNELEADRKYTIRIVQQHCGGNAIPTFTEDLLPKAKVQFVSYRQKGYPFSLTITEDNEAILRVSTCCESRYPANTRLGGKQGQFRWLGVKNAVPCYRCQVHRGLEAPYSNNTEKLVKKKKKSASSNASKRSKKSAKIGSANSNAVPPPVTNGKREVLDASVSSDDGVDVGLRTAVAAGAAAVAASTATAAIESSQSLDKRASFDSQHEENSEHRPDSTDAAHPETTDDHEHDSKSSAADSAHNSETEDSEEDEHSDNEEASDSSHSESEAETEEKHESEHHNEETVQHEQDIFKEESHQQPNDTDTAKETEEESQSHDHDQTHDEDRSEANQTIADHKQEEEEEESSTASDEGSTSGSGSGSGSDSESVTETQTANPDQASIAITTKSQDQKEEETEKPTVETVGNEHQAESGTEDSSSSSSGSEGSGSESESEQTEDKTETESQMRESKRENRDVSQVSAIEETTENACQTVLPMPEKIPTEEEPTETSSSTGSETSSSLSENEENDDDETSAASNTQRLEPENDGSLNERLKRATSALMESELGKEHASEGLPPTVIEEPEAEAEAEIEPEAKPETAVANGHRMIGDELAVRDTSAKRLSMTENQKTEVSDRSPQNEPSTDAAYSTDMNQLSESDPPTTGHQPPGEIWYCHLCNFDNQADDSKCRICGIDRRVSEVDQTDRDETSDVTGPPWTCRVCNFDNGGALMSCRVCGIEKSSCEQTAEVEQNTGGNVVDPTLENRQSAGGRRPPVIDDVIAAETSVRDPETDTLADAESLRHDGDEHTNAVEHPPLLGLPGPTISIEPASPTMSCRSDPEGGAAKKLESTSETFEHAEETTNEQHPEDPKSTTDGDQEIDQKMSNHEEHDEPEQPVENGDQDRTSGGSGRQRESAMSGDEPDNPSVDEPPQTANAKSDESPLCSSMSSVAANANAAFAATMVDDNDADKPDAVSARLRDAFGHENVSVANVQLTSVAMTAMLDRLSQNNNIRSLAIRSAQLTDEQLTSIYETLTTLDLSKLTMLNFNMNRLTSSSVPYLVDLVNRYSVEMLLLHENRFDNESMAALLNAIASSQSLLRLDIGGNELGTASAAEIGELLMSTASLKALSLGGCHFSVGDWRLIAHGLSNNDSGLETLNFSYCNMTDESAEIICTALMNNQWLQSIDFDGNDLTDQTGQLIVELIESAPSLSNVVCAAGNYFTPEISSTIRRLLSERQPNVASEK